MALKQWPGDADREIARRYGVGPDMVGTVRRSLVDLSVGNQQIGAPGTPTVTRGRTTYQQRVPSKTTAPDKPPCSARLAPWRLPPSPPPGPASNVIPLGDHFRPVISEREAERPVRATPAR